jgi:hypothetical protein
MNFDLTGLIQLIALAAIPVAFAHYATRGSAWLCGAALRRLHRAQRRADQLEPAEAHRPDWDYPRPLVISHQQ